MCENWFENIYDHLNSKKIKLLRHVSTVDILPSSNCRISLNWKKMYVTLLSF